jgi:outer membrane protein assembly factor BamB
MDRSAILVSLFWLAVTPLASAQSDYVESEPLHKAGLAKQWQLHLPLAGDQEILDAYLVDDQLYFGTNDGYVFAVDARSGAIRWAQGFTTGGYRLTRPAHVDIRTIIATPPSVVQYDRQYGTPIRKVDLRFPAGTGAVSDGQHMLIGGLDRRLYSFGISDDFERWKVGTDSQLVSRPVVRGEYVYFASDRGTVSACETSNKAFYWQNRSIGSVTADLVADENGVYVASRDRSLYLLDPAFGGTRWRVRLSGPLHEPPVPTKDVAYQYSQSDGLVAVETAVVGIKNRIRWKLQRGRSMLTTHENTAYVLSLDDHLLGVSIKDGSVKSDVPVPGMAHIIPTPGQSVMYLASFDGRVFAVRLRGVPLVDARSVAAALSEPVAEQGAATAPEEESPAPESKLDAGLKTTQGGPPIGGKSKVSKKFGGDGGSESP